MNETGEQDPESKDSPKQPLEAKILSWLNTQGTILELTVASKFKAVLGRNSYSHNVYHARHYREKDPLTLEDKFREIDVVVQATPIFTPSANLTLWLILECKSKANFPWVFFRSSEKTDNYTNYEDAFIVLHNGNFSSRAVVGLRGVSIFNIAGIPYSTSGAAVFSKEADQSGGDERNGVRESILQVLSATAGISKEVGLNSEGLMAAILVPIVVTKAPMFTVTLDDSGTPKIESTLKELVVTRSKLDADSLKYVWVIHESQVDDLCSEFAATLPLLSLNL